MFVRKITKTSLPLKIGNVC